LKLQAFHCFLCFQECNGQNLKPKIVLVNNTGPKSENDVNV